MSMEPNSQMELKSKIIKAEQEKDVKTLETIYAHPDLDISKLAALALGRVEDLVDGIQTTPSYQVEKLGKQNIENLTREIDSEIENLKEKTKNEINLILESKEQIIKTPSILDEDLLDKIAQIEAIDVNTCEYSKDRKQEYISTESKRGNYSVTANQEKFKEMLELDGEILDYSDAEVIYGQGGWNRYGIDSETGTVKLLRGVSNTTGSPEYLAAVEKKAKELGLLD